jgi:hypothetical protein
MPAPTSPVTVKGLVSVLRRRWQTFVSFAALTIVGFALLGLSLPQRFESTAVVRVEPTGQITPTVKVSDQLNMPTEVRAATAEAVVRAAAQATGSTWSPQALSSSTRVISPQDSQLLEITVSSPDAQQAALGANEVAGAYLEQRAVDAGADVAAERTQLDDRLSGLKRRLARLDAPPGTDLSAGHTAQIAALAGQVDQLESDRTELDLHTGPNGTLLDGAEVAPHSSTPALPVFLVAGLALECAVGAAATVWSARRDPSVQDGHRMSQLLDVPVVEADDADVRAVALGDVAAHLVRRLATPATPPTARTVGVVGDHAQAVADAIAAELEARGATTSGGSGQAWTSARPTTTAETADGVWQVRASPEPLLHGTSLQLAQDSARVVVVSVRSGQASSLPRFEELLTLRGGGVHAGVLLPDAFASGAHPDASASTASTAAVDRLTRQAARS